MVVDELDKLHDGFAGCETLAFADLSTQMILVTNTQSTLRREALDSLCAQAVLVLGTNGQGALGQSAATAGAVATADTLRVFLRSTEEPNDALCCICSPTIDAEAFLAAARASLATITSTSQSGA